MLVTIKYQYKSGNGSLNGEKTVAIKGSGNAVDEATKQFLADFFKTNKGNVYLLNVETKRQIAMMKLQANVPNSHDIAKKRKRPDKKTVNKNSDGRIECLPEVADEIIENYGAK